MLKVAIVISGCGSLDGSEIFETVFTLLELDRNNVDVKIFAPDIYQTYVVNHFTTEKMPESRNVLIESARIVRGNIKSLKDLCVKDFNALILPGGLGAVTNLSNIESKNENGTVIETLKEIIVQFYKQSKPIGAICISPIILASVLREYAKVSITLGESNELIKKMGALEKICCANDAFVDQVNKLVTTPAFMLNAPLTQIHQGISVLVNEILKLC